LPAIAWSTSSTVLLVYRITPTRCSWSLLAQPTMRADRSTAITDTDTEADTADPAPRPVNGATPPIVAPPSPTERNTGLWSWRNSSGRWRGRGGAWICSCPLLCVRWMLGVGCVVPRVRLVSGAAQAKHLRGQRGRCEGAARQPVLQAERQLTPTQTALLFCCDFTCQLLMSVPR